MTKQVWILNHYAIEPGGAGGTRHYNLALSLKTHGWKASLIAASVELNTNRQRLASGEYRRLETYNEVDFLWLYAPPYIGNGLARIRNMLAYTMRALRPSSYRDMPKPDLIIGSTVHPLAAVAGAVLARRYKVPFFFEVRDLWPQTLIDMGTLTQKSPISRAMRVMETWLFRRADRIVTLLPSIDLYTTPLGIPPQKLIWIPNGVDLSNPATKPPATSPEQPFSFMYFGAHGVANGLSNILKAFGLAEAELGPDRIRLRLIGDGGSKPALISEAQALGLDRVSFEAPVAKTEISALAAEADAFVCNLVDAPIYRFGISLNKLYDFLAAERPIVFGGASSNNPVDEAGAGITVPPGNPQALADAMIKVAQLSHAERAAMGQSGRRWVEANHGFDNLAAKLAAAMDQAIR